MAERSPRLLPNEPLLPIAIELASPDSRAAKLRAKAAAIQDNIDNAIIRMNSGYAKDAFNYLTPRQTKRLEVSIERNEYALVRTLARINYELNNPTPLEVAKEAGTTPAQETEASVKKEKGPGKIMTAQEHLVNTKAILERGTVKKYGVEHSLTDAQIKRREEETRRIQARIAFDEARGRTR